MLTKIFQVALVAPKPDIKRVLPGKPPCQIPSFLTRKQAGGARRVSSRILYMIKKNGLISENKTATKMLPIFYQIHLQKYLNQSQLITLKLLIWLLQSQKQVKIERLAASLPLPIQQNSRHRHIQRFLSLNNLSVVFLWFPLIQQIMARHIAKGKQLIIALDRTQWKENNIMNGECHLS